MQKFRDVIFVNLAWLHVPVEPAVDGLEGDSEFLGKLGLAELMFKAEDIELVNEVLRHGESRV